MSTPAKHTPGPWSSDGIDGEYSILAANGNPVCSVLIGCENTEWSQTLALIAAAPDLLEALHSLLPFLENVEKDKLVGDEGCIWAVELVRAAIAKAAGRS